MLLITLPILAALCSACEKKMPSAADKRTAAIASAGIRASLTASIHVEAERTCEIVGFPSLDECAKLEGNLLTEKEAKQMADFSMSQSKKYFESCVANLSADYCNKLIERAVQIERRKPPAATEVELPAREK